MKLTWVWELKMQPDQLGLAHRRSVTSVRERRGTCLLAPSSEPGKATLLTRSETLSSKGRSYPRRRVSTTPGCRPVISTILPSSREVKLCEEGAFACAGSLKLTVCKLTTGQRWESLG